MSLSQKKISKNKQEEHILKASLWKPGFWLHSYAPSIQPGIALLSCELGLGDISKLEDLISHYFSN
jgi:hypothetical protein